MEHDTNEDYDVESSRGRPVARRRTKLFKPTSSARFRTIKKNTIRTLHGGGAEPCTLYKLEATTVTKDGVLVNADCAHHQAAKAAIFPCNINDRPTTRQVQGMTNVTQSTCMHVILTRSLTTSRFPNHPKGSSAELPYLDQLTTPGRGNCIIRKSNFRASNSHTSVVVSEGRPKISTPTPSSKTFLGPHHTAQRLKLVAENIISSSFSSHALPLRLLFPVPNSIYPLSNLSIIVRRIMNTTTICRPSTFPDP